MVSGQDDERLAEFDSYAAEYSAGMDVPLKRCLGPNAESFIEVKAKWLLRDLARNSSPGSKDPPRLLDYGCGVGTLLRVLRRLGFRGSLAGCDVSAEMLKEGIKRWPKDDPVALCPIEGARAPFADGEFDAIVLSAVLHHVELPLRGVVYGDVLRLLKPGGRLYVFEHNPCNPLTQWVVRHTPIDRNAVLLRPREVRAGLEQAGRVETRTQYLMFFPPRLTFLRPCERLLGWLPLGAQYVVAATKVAE